MKISLVIPAYNEEYYIGPCLESVIKYRTDDLIEIIVVDNASTDNTANVAKKFAGVRVINEPSKGLTKARQRGLMEAQGDIIAYLDADTRMPQGWISIVKEKFGNDAEMVCLSGPFRYFDLPPFKKFLAEGFWTLSAMPTYWVTGFMVLGANFAAKRQALMQIGGFDTTISFYGEDTDIAFRLSKIGKVRFTMKFFIFGSGRRLMKEGLITTFWRYGLNYYSMAFHHKTLTTQHNDIR